MQTSFEDNKSYEHEPEPPHIEVLGILLTHPNILREYRRKLHPQMFYEYGPLYKMMYEIDEAEGLTFKGLAKRMSTPEKIKRLHWIKSTYVSINRMDGLILTVKKQLISERLRSIGSKIMDTATDPDELVRYLQTELDTLSTTEGDNLLDMEQQVDKWMRWTEEVAKEPALAYGMMTSITHLDNITKGFRRQDFIVLGGRTSMGKSAFEIELALRMTQNGYIGAIFSLEMSNMQIYNRMAANIGQYNLEWIMTGNINDLALHNMKKNSELFKRVYIDDTRGVSADYIADTMKALKRTQGLDFVIVDYLQDVKENGEQNDNSGSAMARVCRKLRSAAQQCDCAVIGLSQISRDVERRDNKRPSNSDLSGSTGIETSADMICLMYRDDYYNPDTDKKDILEINITKNRNGRLGGVELIYDKHKQKIYSR
jgi:replicative DNA helicase